MDANRPATDADLWKQVDPASSGRVHTVGRRGPNDCWLLRDSNLKDAKAIQDPVERRAAIRKIWKDHDAMVARSTNPMIKPPTTIGSARVKRERDDGDDEKGTSFTQAARVKREPDDNTMYSWKHWPVGVLKLDPK